MVSSMGLKSPIFFVSFSFAIGVLNFLDTLTRLMYSVMTRGESYPLGVYLKPVFFFAQAAALIMFIRSVRSVQKPVFSIPSLSRFFSAHTVLVVLVVLLYVDFQLLALARLSIANAFLELMFYLVYLVALGGTSFWFASELRSQRKWRWLSLVFVLIGLAFVTAFLEPMFFWAQNYVGLVFPSQLALVATYAPYILMFLAAMTTVAIFVVLSKRTSERKASPVPGLVLLLFVPAFLLPLLWDSYKDGLINFVIRDVFYWSFGYSSYQWYAVSFFLMSFVAYILTLKELSRRSNHTLAFSLIFWGVASFPWNGVVPLKVGYSSIPGNVISLSSIITGASQLMSQRG